MLAIGPNSPLVGQLFAKDEAPPHEEDLQAVLANHINAKNIEQGVKLQNYELRDGKLCRLGDIEARTMKRPGEVFYDPSKIPREPLTIKKLSQMLLPTTEPTNPDKRMTR